MVDDDAATVQAGEQTTLNNLEHVIVCTYTQRDDLTCGCQRGNGGVANV